MNFKISVILPIYNQELFLKRAIDSLINQSIGFENIEIIMVNDCSTDNSKNIIKKYTDKYPNCKSISLKNNSGSSGKPRNVGLDHASSDYIMFLDPDDTFIHSMCKTLYDTILKEKCDVVVSNIYYIINNEKYIKQNNKFMNNIDGNNDKKIIYKDWPYQWNAIYNRTFLFENNIKCSTNLFDDTYFSYKTMLCSKKLIFLKDYYGYNYYQIPNSLTRKRNESQFYKSYNGITALIELMNEYDIINKEIVYNNLLISLLINSINISFSNKKELLNKICELEKKIDYKIVFNKKWLNFFNFTITRKKYILFSITKSILKIGYNIFGSTYIKKQDKKLYKKIHE